MTGLYNQACMRSASSQNKSLEGTAVSGSNLTNGDVEWLKAPLWSNFGWLWHGFSTRRGRVSRVYLPEPDIAAEDAGELNLGFTAADSQEHVRENRLRFIEAVTGSRETPLVTVRQVHSNLSVIVG